MQDKTNNNQDASEFKVQDRRHWVEDDPEACEGQEEETVVEPAKPTIIDEYRRRTEASEQQLQEYIDAFKKFKDEQEEFRARLARDVDRKVELKFGELVGEFLQSVDDLDLALQHVAEIPEAQPLAQGVSMARDRFLSTIERHGVIKLCPDGEPFDPNESEALRMDEVDSPELDGVVTETLQAGYKLGDLVVRAARVAVGRYTKTGRS